MHWKHITALNDSEKIPEPLVLGWEKHSVLRVMEEFEVLKNATRHENMKMNSFCDLNIWNRKQPIIKEAQKPDFELKHLEHCGQQFLSHKVNMRCLHPHIRRELQTLWRSLTVLTTYTYA